MTNRTTATDTTGIPTRGIIANADGTFTAMTLAASKTFKTRAGAERWFARRTSGAPSVRRERRTTEWERHETQAERYARGW